MQLTVGTGNPGKLQEFQTILAPLGFELIPAPAAYIDMQVEETGNTFEANARIKLAALITCAGSTATLTDDSGLMVDALQGAPGVYSARYAAPPPGSPNLTRAAQDAANRHKLLQALTGIPQQERTARFAAVLAFCFPGEPVQLFEGTCEGHIALTDAGNAGFGYDPLFIPKGHTHTFAQLPPEIKHAGSHRGAAIRQLVAALQHQHRL